MQFSAVATAESGEIVQGVSFSWITSVPGATISNAGLFTAGTTTGTFTEEISASAEAVSGYATVIVQSTSSGRNPSVSFDLFGSSAWLFVPAGLIAGALVALTIRKKSKGRAI